jgi:hypothetical protein
MSVQVIKVPAGLTAQEQMDYILATYNTYFGSQTAGTQVIIEITPTGAMVKAPPPPAGSYVPVSPPPTYTPPATTLFAPYVAPASLPKPPAGQSNVVLMTFEIQIQSGTYAWGCPIGLPNGHMIIGGDLNGTNVVASSSNFGFTWAVIGYPPILIQEMAITKSGLVVGRDAAEVNYVQSPDNGVTWESSSYSGWLGGGSNGFYN